MKKISRFAFSLMITIFSSVACISTSTIPTVQLQPTIDVADIQTQAVQDMINKLTANAPTFTPIPLNSSTPIASPTKLASLTPADSPTPKPPTDTPIPTVTSTPEFQPETKEIGPIHDSLHDSMYSVEITLKNVQWVTESGYDEPKTGNIFLIADVEVKNLGPGELRSVGIYSFQVKDSKGAIRDYEMLSGTYNTCQIESVDLISGGSVEGCVTFEVPTEGRIELIYAPFKYEGLEPGRYISFVIREK